MNTRQRFTALGALPSWLVTRALLPFLPPSHPWHRKRFSLVDWHVHQTPICRWFDVMLTVSVGGLVVDVVAIFLH